jgi:formylglycine-generating enzyme required for sulfatase activity
VLDMAGNVWEWTRSLEKSYPYDPDDGREDPEAAGARVVRGGVFHFDAWDVRCAFRGRHDPGLRFRVSGLRVVVGLGLPL